MQRITERDVGGMFVRFRRAAEASGAATMSWGWVKGSKTNGNAYEVRANTYSSTLPGGSTTWRLGMTARAAFDALHTAAIALEQAEIWRSQS